MSAPLPRKLAAILSADAENFSGRMGEDEAGAFIALRAARTIIDGQIANHGGRIANTAGDGLIAEFPSVVQAVRAAVEIQQALTRDGGALLFRIGLHMGDVITHGEDLLGDGVNLAARVQAQATPGAVLVTQQVYDQMHGKVDYGFASVGAVTLKNMQEPVALYAVQAPDVADMTPLAANASGKTSKRAISAKKILTICAVIWALLILRSSIFGTSVGATWIGLAVSTVMVVRLISALGHPKPEAKILRPAMIVVSSFVALVLAGQWVFWLALPAAAFAAYAMTLKVVAPK